MELRKFLIPVLIIVLLIFHFLSGFLITRPLQKIANDFNPDSIIEVTNRDDIQLFTFDEKLMNITEFIIENSISSNDDQNRGELHPYYFIILEDGTIIDLTFDYSRSRIYMDIYNKRGNSQVHRVLYDCLDTIVSFEEMINASMSS